jgi:hypothetical protein
VFGRKLAEQLIWVVGHFLRFAALLFGNGAEATAQYFSST